METPIYRHISNIGGKGLIIINPFISHPFQTSKFPEIGVPLVASSTAQGGGGSFTIGNL